MRAKILHIFSVIFKSDNRHIFSFVGVLVLVGIFLAVTPAYALPSIERLTANIIGSIAAFAGYLFTQILLFFTGLLVDVASYNGFVTQGAVNVGWVIVRDMTNMFFILVMLIIAFGTILGVEDLSYRRLLPRLLIMAVLINFSKVIAGVIIDFSQVVMLTFVNGFRAIAGGNFVRMFQVNATMTVAPEAITQAAERGDSVWPVVGSLILGAALMLIAATVILIMTFILIGRIVMLWLLVVLSPLVFMLSAFPRGKAAQVYSKWWDLFGNYVLIGPFLAFFLWLSLAVAGSGEIAGDTGITVRKSSETNPHLFVSEAGGTDNMLGFIIGIALLMGGMILTQEFGVMGGSAMSGSARWIQNKGTNFAKGVVKVPLGAAAMGARLAESKFASKTGVRLPGFGHYLPAIKAGLESKIKTRGEKARDIARQRMQRGGAMGAVAGFMGDAGAVAKSEMGLSGALGRVAAAPFRAAWNKGKGRAWDYGEVGNWEKQAERADVHASNRDKIKGNIDAEEGKEKAAIEELKVKRAEFDKLDSVELDGNAVSQLQDSRTSLESLQGTPGADRTIAAIDAMLEKARRGESVSKDDMKEFRDSGGRAQFSDQYDLRRSRALKGVQDLEAQRDTARAKQAKLGEGYQEAEDKRKFWEKGSERARLDIGAPEVPKHALNGETVAATISQALKNRDWDTVAAYMKKGNSDGNLEDVLKALGHGAGFDGVRAAAQALEGAGMKPSDVKAIFSEISSENRSKGKQLEYTGLVKVGTGGRLDWAEKDSKYQESKVKMVDKGNMGRKLREGKKDLFTSSDKDGNTTIDAAGAAIIATRLGDIVKSIDDGRMSGDLMRFFASSQEGVLKAAVEGGVKAGGDQYKSLADAIGKLGKQMENLPPKLTDTLRRVQATRKQST